MDIYVHISAFIVLYIYVSLCIYACLYIYIYIYMKKIVVKPNYVDNIFNFTTFHPFFSLSHNDIYKKMFIMKEEICLALLISSY